MIDANMNVVIKSMVNEPIGLTLSDLRIRREWPKKGAIQKIKFGDLEEGIFDPGFEYMLRTGMLYIEDMAIKRALGLEPEEAKEPVNLVVLSEAQQKRYLTVAPIHEFKDVLERLSHEQLLDLAQTAVKLEVSDTARCELLKELTNVDVLKAIIINREIINTEQENS